MGNESSTLNGLQLDDKAIEVTDFWVHHSAKIAQLEQSQELSVFVSDYVVCGSVWENRTPLEKYAKNLMLYRHPCILKYISSWNKGSKFYLAVERVRPLSHVLASQSTLQICIGLYSILKALIFLHDKGKVSHNNVCSASIYVTHDGNWKLGGLEFLCKFADLTRDYLSKTRTHRYENAIHSNEDKYIQDDSVDSDFVDLYAYGVLVEEILKKRLNDDTTPGLKYFYNIFKNEIMQSPESFKRRQKFTEIINNPFFTHEFVNIYSFLSELPLKGETEKANFFATLIEKLETFPEESVAENLGELLLSRLVLLDNTARKVVLPVLLCPKETGIANNKKYLFSTETFKKFLVPKLLQIFKVNDLQIRELLLQHFKNFMLCFSKEQLKNTILPELLLGIKDKNDNLVAMTLRSLADLVLVLGSETVIGGKRAKLFSDGRPIAHNEVKPPLKITPYKHTEFREPPLPVLLEIPSEENETNTEYVEENPVCLPERPSPDGGEDDITTDENVDVANEDLDWSDWDIQDTEQTIVTQSTVELDQSPTLGSTMLHCSEVATKTKPSPIILPDISELDIKSQSVKSKKGQQVDDIDFFQDMEPVIDCSNKFLVSDVVSKSVSELDSNLAIKSNSMIPGDEWNDELDWNIDN